MQRVDRYKQAQILSKYWNGKVPAIIYMWVIWGNWLWVFLVGLVVGVTLLMFGG